MYVYVKRSLYIYIRRRMCIHIHTYIPTGLIATTSTGRVFQLLCTASSGAFEILQFESVGQNQGGSNSVCPIELFV